MKHASNWISKKYIFFYREKISSKIVGQQQFEFVVTKIGFIFFIFKVYFTIRQESNYCGLGLFQNHLQQGIFRFWKLRKLSCSHSFQDMTRVKFKIRCRQFQYHDQTKPYILDKNKSGPFQYKKGVSQGFEILHILFYIWPDKGGDLKAVLGFQNVGYDYEGLGEMFEGGTCPMVSQPGMKVPGSFSCKLHQKSFIDIK